MSSAAAGGPHTAAIGYVGFLERFAADLARADEPVALIVVHLSNLNRINSAAGYRIAHELRSAFAAALTAMLRGDDWMLVLTEDRLCLVLHHVRNAGHMMLAANRIALIASRLPRPDGVSAMLEARVGAALCPEHGNTAEKLLRNSELALESAAIERASYAMYRPDVSKLVTANWSLQAEIGAAIENGEFELAYQAKVDAATLAPCGAEALLRWASPRLGDVSPAEFIPAAEASNRIDALTDIALHRAARDAARWPQIPGGFTVAINLSPIVIERGDIVGSFEHVAAIWGLGMDRFTAEVTENGLISTAGAGLRVLHELRQAGVRVSIDDFGTGNSSLAYFKDIPADELKIDKSFIFAMAENESNACLVKTIIDLGHAFGLQVVAEGVEDAACVERLQKFGCDVLQGYYFSKPLPIRDFIGYLGQTYGVAAALCPA